jgi:hypothetical protein
MTEAVSEPTELQACKKMSSKPFWATVSVLAGSYATYKGLSAIKYYAMDVLSGQSTVIAASAAALLVAGCVKAYSANAKLPGGLTGYFNMGADTPSADALKTASTETNVAKTVATAEVQEIGNRLEPKSPESKF